MRDYKLRLKDILESIEKIELYTKSLNRAKFYSNPMAVDSVLRNPGIIGEASHHIPFAIRKKISDIEWRKIGGIA